MNTPHAVALLRRVLAPRLMLGVHFPPEPSARVSFSQGQNERGWGRDGWKVLGLQGSKTQMEPDSVVDGEVRFSVCISKQGPPFCAWTHSLPAKPWALRGQIGPSGSSVAWPGPPPCLHLLAPSANGVRIPCALAFTKSWGNHTGSLRRRKLSVCGQVPGWVSFRFTAGGCAGRAGLSRGLSLSRGICPIRSALGQVGGAPRPAHPSGGRSARAPRCPPARS